jgi:NMD protein affecting ribosome stability and mRNA decay
MDECEYCESEGQHHITCPTNTGLYLNVDDAVCGLCLDAMDHYTLIRIHHSMELCVCVGCAAIHHIEAEHHA